ncbi:MAG TPA: sigma-70 family RNA polymerase sigma factor [Verrucomicrobiae bacterium]
MDTKVNGSIPTRQSLLSRLKDWEDDESWKEFFDTYWKLIYNTAIKAGLRDAEAQDVVQETVLAVSKSMRKFRYDPAVGPFKGWLLKTTRWKISDHFNRVRKKDVSSPKTPDRDSEGTATVERVVDPASLDLDAAWEADWQKNLFDSALEHVKRKVRPKTFQLFELCVIKEWPVSKITRTLGVNMFKVHLARHRVSKMIEKEVRRLETRVI